MGEMTDDVLREEERLSFSNYDKLHGVLNADTLGTVLAHEGIEPPDDVLERLVGDLRVRLSRDTGGGDEALREAEQREAYWRDGLPFTREGQLEHSRQHRDEPSEHPVFGGHCRVAARIVAIERAALAATDLHRRH